jgi:hypothetical protein
MKRYLVLHAFAPGTLHALPVVGRGASPVLATEAATLLRRRDHLVCPTPAVDWHIWLEAFAYAVPLQATVVALATGHLLRITHDVLCRQPVPGRPFVAPRGARDATPPAQFCAKTGELGCSVVVL